MKNPFAQSEQQYDGSFLPEDYVARRAEVRANFIALMLFGIVVFSIVAAFFVSNRQWTTVKTQRAIITAEYQAAKEKIDQLKELDEQKKEMLDKAEITTSLIERVPRSVLLSQLVQRMPEQITLLDMKLESKKAVIPTAKKPNQATRGSLSRGKGKAEEKPKMVAPTFIYTVTVVGVTPKNEHITDYLASLSQCDLFDRVDLQYIKERTIDEVDLREFEIKAKISRRADARSVKSPEQLKQGSESVAAKRVSEVDGEEN
jgi:Tfp pilus assembly protein PilN